MAIALRPRWRAVSSRGVGAIRDHDGDAGIGIAPAAMLSAMATKLEPRPERRMPRFFMEHNEESRSFASLRMTILFHATACEADSHLAEHDFAIAFGDAADAVKFLSGALQERLRLLEFAAGRRSTFQGPY